MIDKIFVCHHKPLIHRKKYLQDFFEKNKIDVEWIENFLPKEVEKNYSEFVGIEELNKNPITYNISLDRYNLFPEWFNHIKKFKNNKRDVSIPELSLYLKQKECFEKHLKHNYNYILILEDDIILPDNFLEYVNRCVSEFNIHTPKLDCLVFGTCCGFISNNIKEDKLVYYDPTYLTRCAHAIMYSLDASEKIYKNLYPVNWPIDFKLNEIIIQENLKVGWVEPPLQQASHLNLDKSTIQL